MTDQDNPGRVLQMRLVVETADYDEAVAFYRDVLGAREELVVHGDDGEKVTILDVGRATLELSNPAQVAMIDEVEVGRRVSPRLRVAFEVADARGDYRCPGRGGAELIARADRDAVAVAQLAAVRRRPICRSRSSRSSTPTDAPSRNDHGRIHRDMRDVLTALPRDCSMIVASCGAFRRGR